MLKVGDHTLDAAHASTARVNAFSTLGSALSTFYAFTSGILKLAIPAISAARAFPIVCIAIDIPLSFYDLGVGLYRWFSKGASKRISGLYDNAVGFIGDSLLNAGELGGIIAPLAFALAGPILAIAGFGIYALYFARELKTSISKYKAATAATDEASKKSAKRQALTNAGFMVGSIAVIAVVAALTFSPVGPAVIAGLSGLLIGIALYRLIIKLVKPVNVKISTPPVEPATTDKTPGPDAALTPTVTPMLSDRPIDAEVPAFATFPTLFGGNIPKACCYALS